MVGRDDQKEHLLEDLTKSYSGEPKVIPIVGMGGIGKTTLAKEVYIYGSMLCHFDVRSKATVSQQHNIKKIFLSLLQSTIKMDDTVKMKGEVELVDMLQKSLKRKSYLIVLDDIWSCKDGVRRCFPTEENAGNQILLTTHNDEVACYDGKALPYKFETVEKKIADECRGLPLTIVVVAGLLKSKRTIEDWENVAKDVKLFVTNDPDKQCSRVLGLSYNHLTIDLKGLMQLRHLKLSTCYLPDCPSGSVDKGRHLDFSNLQTISYLSDRCCMKEVIVEIQNVKKLGIRQDENDYGCSRKCRSFSSNAQEVKVEKNFSNLEVLMLMDYACDCEEWHVRGFTRLKLLLNEYSFLKYWKA
ncbi:putative late blight resistance protein homolog R1B-17 [Capsicum annuum]|uniref:putative late blight resistance protein homolog R1B-17 n=1 Tax=Capsicum annuum TaxID=4072 RepID=UPI001FB164DB|nr:putative late blight resistance protein homolog R1B-17 [Capsicum annuum]